MRPFSSPALRPLFSSASLGLRRQVLRSRPSFHHATRLRHGAQVHVKRKFFTKDRGMLWATYAIVSFFAGRYVLGKLLDGVEIEVVITTEDKEDDEEGAVEGEDEDGMVAVEDDDAVFIAMQYPKKLPQVLYKQSDPEWQEFMKFSRDKERQKAVKKELAEKLRTHIEHTPPLNQKLGNDIKWSKMWLDFSYPDGPPPEYVRKGWLVLDEGIAWSTQTIPHAEYQQIRNILWPMTVFGALKSSVELFYKLQTMKVKGAFGLELNQTEKQLHLAVRLRQMRQKSAAKSEEDGSMQQQVQKQDTEILGPTTTIPTAPSTGSAIERAKEYMLKIPQMPISDDFSIVSTVFLSALVMNWNAAQLDRLPPGCCFVTGDVELFGTQARCKLDVLAAYNPKDNKYIWVSSKPKRIWNRRQGAKGGP